MRTMDRLRKYWHIEPPVRLVHQDSFNGVCITPLHEDKGFCCNGGDDENV